jgi:iron(III) transport system substrate-binding protein
MVTARSLARLPGFLLLLLAAASAWGQQKSWETEWNELLAAAKKEGKLVLASSADPVLRKEIIPRFTARFGIAVEFLAVQGNAGIARFRTERQAGVYSVDAWLAGVSSAIVAHLEKMLDPLKPQLILPDVVEPSKWKKGKLWFVDPEQQYVLRTFSTVVSPVSINAAYVGPEEIRSFKDLLNPKWKGKITSRDPALGGSADTLASVLYDRLGEEFVKKLYIDQKPVFSRDRRTTPEWLARGTYPICLACNSDELELLRKEGFKLVEIFEFSDGPAYLSSIPWVLVAMNRPPHPNAARVFMNWILSQEAIEIYSRGFGSVTLRTDVDESFLIPSRIPRPGVNYVDTADWHWKTVREQELATRIRNLLKSR